MMQDDSFIKLLLTEGKYVDQYKAVFVDLCPHLLSINPETLVVVFIKLEDGIISFFNLCSSSQENVDLFRRIFEGAIPDDVDEGFVSRLLEKHLRAQ